MNKGVVLVKEAMKMNPISVKTKTNVKEVAELMRKHKIGNCIVIDEKPIGIITESDIVKKVVAKDLKASKIPVENIMSTPLLIAEPYISIEEAVKIMGKCNIRRLPVLENGKLIGIITQKDISRISPILHEISREWYDITMKDETYLRKQIFSGKCEDCGALSTNLKNVDDRLICEDCIDALKYE